MADWGDLIDLGIDIISNRATGTPPPMQYFGSPGGPATPPPVVAGIGRVTRTGVKCRRRRRRLLTPTDLSDLAALKTITGGGQALNFAVMKAVRR